MRRVFAIILHKSFDKAYKKLDASIKEAFIERRNLLMIDYEHPALNNHVLHGKWEGHRSINVTGDFRAVFRTEGFIAIFITIGTHPQLYGE